MREYIIIMMYKIKELYNIKLNFNALNAFFIFNLLFLLISFFILSSASVPVKLTSLDCSTYSLALFFLFLSSCALDSLFNDILNYNASYLKHLPIPSSAAFFLFITPMLLNYTNYVLSFFYYLLIINCGISNPAAICYLILLFATVKFIQYSLVRFFYASNSKVIFL